MSVRNVYHDDAVRVEAREINLKRLFGEQVKRNCIAAKGINCKQVEVLEISP